MDIKLKPRLVEIKKGENIVILTEEEYERILDILDVMEAEKVLADESDTVISWEEVRGKLVENRIAEARKARGITQKELARRLKVKPSTVSRLERKDTKPRLDTLKKVAKALKCSVHDLI